MRAPRLRLRWRPAEKARLLDERAHVADKAKLKKGLRALTTRTVEAMLEFVPTSPNADIAYHRRTLGALVRRIELDPDARTTRVQYTVGLGGAKLASPRRTAAKPAIKFVRKMYLKGFRRRIIGLPVAID